MSTEDVVFWLSWCIEEYASSKGMAATDVAQFFEQNGVLQYLSENAEILHTQGKSFIFNCVKKFLQNNH